jgi:hypothetical protein
MRPLLSLLLPVLLGVVPGQAQVPDPTRPAGYGVESGLQTVILRPGGKSGAVISGRYVEVGAMLGEHRVLKITENEVTLQGEDGTEVIRAISAVGKIPRKPAVEEKKTPAAKLTDIEGTSER